MHDNSIIFSAPKRGGILQSSGFLDLKSLMALNRTCKVNMIDELSFMLLIENELTRNHERVKTMQQAIGLWIKVCRDERLKQWLERDSRNDAESIEITLERLSIALPYDVMLSKMLRAVPKQAERLRLVSEENEWTGVTLLHRAARSGNVESLKAVLSIYPESERLKAVRMQDNNGWNLLHWVTQSGHHEPIQFILSLYPETERLQAVRTRDQRRSTVLHHAAISGNVKSLNAILALYPETERLQALLIQDQSGRTVLHYAAKNVECIKVILSLNPEADLAHASTKDEDQQTVLHSARSENPESIQLIHTHCPTSEIFRFVSMQDENGWTVLHFAALLGNLESIETILTSLPESQRLPVLETTNHDGETVLHCAAHSSKIECIKAVLSLYPESERNRVVSMTDRAGNTVLERMHVFTRNTILEWLSESSELNRSGCIVG